MANRDEFHGRPAEPLHWWDQPPVLAGRDGEAGGTWLAVDRRGRVAAVTNYREWPRTQGARSRGELPLRALAPDLSWDALEPSLRAQEATYGGFNLLVADRERCLSLSNREPEARHPPPGLHGLSNGSLDAGWPKVRRGVRALGESLEAGRLDLESLRGVLADERPAADEELPDTGVGRDTERFLSPCFIRGEDYGTRAVTVIRVGHHAVEVAEWRYGPGGRALGHSERSFGLPPESFG